MLRPLDKARTSSTNPSTSYCNQLKYRHFRETLRRLCCRLAEACAAVEVFQLCQWTVHPHQNLILDFALFLVKF